jgi:hypothetical protein
MMYADDVALIIRDSEDMQEAMAVLSQTNVSQSELLQPIKSSLLTACLSCGLWHTSKKIRTAGPRSTPSWIRPSPSGKPKAYPSLGE